MSTLSLGIDDIHVAGEGECIISIAPSEGAQSGELEMGPCESDDAWTWSINDGGVLRWDRHRARRNFGMQDGLNPNILFGGPLARLIDIASDGEQKDDSTPDDEETSASCLWKTSEAPAVTAPCQSTIDASSERSPVSFSVIQYQNSAAVSPQLPRFPRHEDLVDEATSHSLSINESNSTVHVGSARTLPHMKRSSQDHASVHDSKNYPKSNGIKLNAGHPSQSASVTNNPIRNDNRQEVISPLGVGGYFERKILSSKNQPDMR